MAIVSFSVFLPERAQWPGTVHLLQFCCLSGKPCAFVTTTAPIINCTPTVSHARIRVQQCPKDSSTTAPSPTPRCPDSMTTSPEPMRRFISGRWTGLRFTLTHQRPRRVRAVPRVTMLLRPPRSVGLALHRSRMRSRRIGAEWVFIRGGSPTMRSVRLPTL